MITVSEIVSLYNVTVSINGWGNFVVNGEWSMVNSSRSFKLITDLELLEIIAPGNSRDRFTAVAARRY